MTTRPKATIRRRLAVPALALAAALLASACAPAAHIESVPGGDTALMLRVADAARHQGDPSSALPIYRRAHRIDPLNPEPLLRIGATLNALGAYREAGEAWSAALRLDPKSFEALTGYATSLTALAQPATALEYYRRALAIDENAALYNGMGVAYDMSGQPGEAQQAYRDGLRLGGGVGLANNLGLSLALSGHYEEAIATLEAAVTLPGAGARHRQNLAMAYALAGVEGRAVALGRRDLDEIALRRNLGFYATLRGLPGHAEKVSAVGTWHAGAYPGAVPAESTRAGR